MGLEKILAGMLVLSLAVGCPGKKPDAPVEKKGKGQDSKKPNSDDAPDVKKLADDTVARYLAGAGGQAMDEVLDNVEARIRKGEYDSARSTLRHYASDDARKLARRSALYAEATYGILLETVNEWDKLTDKRKMYITTVLPAGMIERKLVGLIDELEVAVWNAGTMDPRYSRLPWKYFVATKGKSDPIEDQSTPDAVLRTVANAIKCNNKNTLGTMIKDLYREKYGMPSHCGGLNAMRDFKSGVLLGVLVDESLGNAHLYPAGSQIFRLRVVATRGSDPSKTVFCRYSAWKGSTGFVLDMRSEKE